MLTKKSDVNLEAKTSAPAKSFSAPPAKLENTSLSKSAAPSKKEGVTRIIVKYDVGFGNQLFIRGKGAELSWENGILLKNISSNEWLWETSASFPVGEFKVLINDFQYEIGDNHRLEKGANIEYTPKFQA